MSRYLDRELLFFDGAMGTMLQRRGLPPGERPDVMNLRAPDTVAAVHRAYREAGSDILCTNTFGANAPALAKTGYSVRDIVTAGVRIARGAAPDALIALDVGPLGAFISPAGELPFEAAAELFREQAEYGAAAGADLIAIETMMDLTELRAAITGARAGCALPIFATMSFETNGRTFAGCSARDFAAAAEELGVAALGINCSYLPDDIFPVFAELAGLTSLPLIAKPNAGLPDKDGAYTATPEAFAASMRAFTDAGAAIVGACCGSDPDYIRAMRALLGNTGN
ncbi:MAG: homocysteine S-methyltransferase family protein [Oscillospiraceae bacterium]|jgi:5-methyltetrahydrofolate--homocysteine methyltransferase|nr:homocysteine S-methyltransferase family protein [Oscillospiraceae bacterium]